MTRAPYPSAADANPPKNRLSPKKLLLTKWTAVVARDKEKHFMVIRVVEPVQPQVRIEQVELEAVHSKRTFLVYWRDLTHHDQWLQGWV